MTDRGCALLGDGTVRCWGPSDSARASDGGLPVPMTVPGLQHIEQIGAANGTRYARDADGAFFAWGSNWSGSLGSGERDDSPLPLRIEW